MESPKKIRYVDEVIAYLIKIIPPSETGLVELLQNYSESLWNIAPECKSYPEYFAKVCKILENNVGEINAEWKDKLVSEWKEIIIDVNEHNRRRQ